jgi:hypothetical protein
MKFKPRKEDLYEIVGTQQEVAINGVPKDSLGALLCRGNDATIFGVGSGSLLTKANRENSWRDRGLLNTAGRTIFRGIKETSIVAKLICSSKSTPS